MGLGVPPGQRKRAPDNRRSSGALGLRSCRAAAGLACRSNSPHASNGRAGWAEDTTAPGLSPRRQSAVEQGISPVGRLRRERWGSAVARPTPLCHCQEGAARRSHRTGHKSSQVSDGARALRHSEGRSPEKSRPAICKWPQVHLSDRQLPPGLPRRAGAGNEMGGATGRSCSTLSSPCDPLGHAMACPNNFRAPPPSHRGHTGSVVLGQRACTCRARAAECKACCALSKTPSHPPAHASLTSRPPSV